MTATIAIANDHAGLALKRALLPMLQDGGYTILDLGTDAADAVDYPEYGTRVAQAVTSGEAQRGIAICGSGIGISIAANRVAGARAALCHNELAARMARQHNDANILCLGARTLSDEEARGIAHVFFTTDFEGGRHAARVAQLG